MSRFFGAALLAVLAALPAGAADEFGQASLPEIRLPAAAVQARMPAAGLSDLAEPPALPAPLSGVSEVVPEKLKASTPMDARAMGVSMPSVPDGLPPQPPEDIKSAGSSLFDKASDQFHYTRHLAREFWWYTVTHIGDHGDRRMWPTYSSRADGAPAGLLPVTRHRSLFSHLRVMGGSGRFYILGPAARDDQGVLAEGRKTFAGYFTSSAVGDRERASFAAFLSRAAGYNAEKRNRTNLRKHVRDALLEASVTPTDRVAGFFDSLLPPEKHEQALRFQAEEQDKVLSDFRKALLDTIAEEPASARDRVLAAVLLGSFADGGATPTSDLDVELLTANGGSGRVTDFDRRFSVRWKTLGYRHPVTIKEVAGPASRGFLDKVYWTNHLIITPSAGFQERLQRKPGEPPSFLPEHRLTLRGRIGRAVQRAFVHGATILSDIRDKRSRP